MKRYDRITPEGTKDWLFEACAARREVENKLRHLFETRAFVEVNTPAFEFYDVFFSNARYFPQESMYKLVDNKGRILVVRPDSTIPIARLTSTKLREHRLPIRLYYSQCIYRQTPSLCGRSDEEMQMGVELIGAAGEKADMDILSLSTRTLSLFPLGDFRLELGHIGIFKKLLEVLDATQSQKDDIHEYIDSKNYSALNDLLDKLGASRAALMLKELPRLFGGAEVFCKARTLFSGFDPHIESTIDYLEKVYNQLVKSNLSDKVIIDFGLVNQADYYSGIIFRGYLSGVGEPVLSGGRYDSLLKDFGEDLPAIGFGLSVDLLADELLKHDGESLKKLPDVLVYSEKAYIQKALVEIEALQEKGVLCEFSLSETADDALCYAKAKGIKQILFVDETTSSVEL